MASGANSNLTLDATILAALKLHGAATVVRWKRYGVWQTVSGAEMAARIEAIGRGLRTLGLNSGDVAGVIGDNCCEWVLADLGIVSAGGVSAGFDAHGDADELMRLVNQSQARVLFVAGDDQLHKAMRMQDRCPSLSHIIVMHAQWDDGANASDVVALPTLEAMGRAGGDVAFEGPSPDTAAVIVYSSGATGPARGAILTHAAIRGQALRAAAALGLRADDERLSLTAIHHVLERVVGIYSSLIAGTIVNFAESRDTALANLAELQPTVVQASPQIWARLRSGILLNLAETTPLQRAACRAAFALADRAGGAAPVWQAGLRWLSDRLVLAPIRARIGLGRARLCLSSGARWQPDVVGWFAALGRDLVDVYGHAESGGAVAFATADAAIAAPDPAAIKIAGHDEVWINVSGALVGYAGGDPAAVSDGWWRSGDIAQRDGGGQLRIVGRLTDLLATADGGAVNPFASERALIASPYIADAFLCRDRRGQTSARILLDFDNAVKFAQDRGIPFTHFRSICKAAEIHDLVAQAVAAVNRAHPAIPIDTFSLIDRSLGPGDVEVTPTLTLRRYLLRDAADDGPAGSARTADLELLKT